MSIKNHLTSAAIWTLCALFLFIIVDNLSNIAPDFRVFGLVLLGAFVIYGMFRLRKRSEHVRSSQQQNLQIHAKLS